MLNFDEEIKKFDKSIEPDEIDDALAKSDITDMNDIMFKMMQNAADKRLQQVEVSGQRVECRKKGQKAIFINLEVLIRKNGVHNKKYK